MTDHEDIAALLRRLDTTERNASDTARILTAHNEELEGAKKRLTRLEEAHQERRIFDAGEAERMKAIQVDVATVKDDMKSMKGTVSKGIWVVITAIILAFTTFVLRGGLVA